MSLIGIPYQVLGLLTQAVSIVGQVKQWGKSTDTEGVIKYTRFDTSPGPNPRRIKEAEQPEQETGESTGITINVHIYLDSFAKESGSDFNFKDFTKAVELKLAEIEANNGWLPSQMSWNGKEEELQNSSLEDEPDADSDLLDGFWFIFDQEDWG